MIIHFVLHHSPRTSRYIPEPNERDEENHNFLLICSNWGRNGYLRGGSGKRKRNWVRISENLFLNGMFERNGKSLWGMSNMCRRNLKNSKHSVLSVRGMKVKTPHGTLKALVDCSWIFFCAVLNPAVQFFEIIWAACKLMSAVRTKVFLNGTGKPYWCLERLDTYTFQLSSSMIFKKACEYIPHWLHFRSVHQSCRQNRIHNTISVYCAVFNSVLHLIQGQSHFWNIWLQVNIKPIVILFLLFIDQWL